MSHIKNILFLVSTLLLSCRDNADSTELTENPLKRYFISATPTQDIPLETLQAITAGLGQKDIAALLKYGVKTYRLVYETTFKGKAIRASGVIMIPKGLKEEAPLLSLQHGTTFERGGAPSETDGFSGMELFASAGYIAVMPDFIGYGESSQEFHPYYDQQSSSSVVIDMIRSAKEFLHNEKVPFNDKLFLAGYSEGGYVTLAAAKEIEQHPDYGLNITAVAAGAGGYDLQEMLKGISTKAYYSYPGYLAFVLLSYNKTYDWNHDLTYFFKPRYAEAVEAYINGEYGGSFINSRLTTNLDSLFDDQFYARLKSQEGELQLKKALYDNSVAGWFTNIPIRLYHGTKDEIIPYQNSEVTLANFKSSGSKDVTLTLIPNGSHGSSFAPMMRDFIPWFLSLK